jgi:phosphorylase kinase alpha/beta subunit
MAAVFTYLWLDSLFNGDKDQSRFMGAPGGRSPLSRMALVCCPNCITCPRTSLEAERQKPGSQPRSAQRKCAPGVGAKPLYIGAVAARWLTETGGHRPPGAALTGGRTHRYPVVQIALLAEDKALQDGTGTYGLPTQVLEEIDPGAGLPGQRVVVDLCRNWQKPTWS